VGVGGGGGGLFVIGGVGGLDVAGDEGEARHEAVDPVGAFDFLLVAAVGDVFID
jgi:hypothetical protein